MNRRHKTVLAVAGALGLFTAGLLMGANKFGQPKTLIHVVTVQWNDGTTDAQKQAVYDGVRKMAGEIPGIRNVWTNPIKVQGQGYNGAFVMEFDSKEAMDAYAKHPAHDEWAKVYGPVHKESTTHDITN
jgi:redox-regulated HSP33 family molecular chaperone